MVVIDLFHGLNHRKRSGIVAVIFISIWRLLLRDVCSITIQVTNLQVLKTFKPDYSEHVSHKFNLS